MKFKFEVNWRDTEYNNSSFNSHKFTIEPNLTLTDYEARLVANVLLQYPKAYAVCIYHQEAFYTVTK